MKLNTKYFNIVETFFIFSSDHNWWLSIYQYIVHSVSGALRTLHWPTLSAAGPAGQDTLPHHGGDGDLRWSRIWQWPLNILPQSYWCRLGDNYYPAREEEVILLINVNSITGISTGISQSPCWFNIDYNFKPVEVTIMTRSRESRFGGGGEGTVGEGWGKKDREGKKKRG